jgi:DNA-binding CsgD family transcriptional regulator
MLHILLLFHISVSVLFAFQAFGFDIRRGPERILRRYKRVLWVWSVVLFGNAILGYLYANVIGIVTDTSHLSLVEFYQYVLSFGVEGQVVFWANMVLGIAASPVLLLLVIPSFSMSLTEGKTQVFSRLKPVFFRISIITAFAALCLHVISTVVLVLALGDDTLAAVFDTYLFMTFPIILGAAYALLGAWALLAVIEAKQYRWFKTVAYLPYALAGLLFFLILMLFEMLDYADVVKIPVFSDLVAAASPYGLQLHWLLAAWIGVYGILFVRSAAFRLDDIAPDAIRIFADLKLSPREQEIALMVVQGTSNKEIARNLDISYNTVKNHIANIFKKLDVANRFEMIKYLQQTRCT